MLQQTTVAAVIPYFKRFTAAWPNVAALAAAAEEEVMAAWAGLGYYARARNLVKCAQVISTDLGGQFPAQEAELLKLPGIGPYTAAAIAAIAFGQRAVVVDANVERVVSRLFAIATPLPAGKADIRVAMDAITPDAQAGDFAQAMMDLGASICSVKAPKCGACPLARDCMARQQKHAEAYPVKPPKKAKPARIGTVYWIVQDDAVWLVKRPEKGMLGGMRSLPDDGWNARVDGDAKPPFPADWQILNMPVSHVFTHFSLKLNVAIAAPDSAIPADMQGEFWPLNSLDKAGLPTLFNKAAKAAMAQKKQSKESA